MRISITTVVGLYIFLQIMYYLFARTHLYWDGINIITHVGFVVYVSYLLERNNSIGSDEQLLFSYVKYLSIGNIMYIITCMVREDYFAIYNTPIVAYILGIGFVSFIIHRALK